MLKIITTTLTFVITLLLSSNAFAASWVLDKDKSAINFVSVKKTNIAESHTFTDFSSSITETGQTSVVIQNSSVETAVEIRNDRLRRFLFETADFPETTITTDISKITPLSAGESITTSLPATLSLHGVSKEIILNVLINQSTNNTMLVASTQPIIIKASDYGMDKGLAKLSELMGGISLGQSVPVSFALTFTQ
ncbi:MAG: YceI family protein [Arenicella sp.]